MICLAGGVIVEIIPTQYLKKLSSLEQAMRFSKTQLIALAILPIGYGLVAAASNLLQFFCGLGAILGAATWLLLATLHQQKNSPRSHSRLPTPWLVLGIGFVLMLFGLFLFVPAAERLAIEQYLILQSQGFQFGYLDGIDEIGFGIVLIFAVFCLPISLLIGLIGTCLLYTSPSPRDRTRSRMPSSA